MMLAVMVMMTVIIGHWYRVDLGKQYTRSSDKAKLWPTYDRP